VTPENVLAAVAETSAPVHRVAIGTLDVIPTVPSHHWVLVPLSSGEISIGGVDRGIFRPYLACKTEDEAVRLLTHVLTPTPATSVTNEEALVDRRHAASLRASLAQRAATGEQLHAHDLAEGTLLDHIGFDSGHCLFVLDTPFSARSAPPTDLDLPRAFFRIAQPLPSTVPVGQIQPWFGQPGGGIVVQLNRPVRWYVDEGLLDAVDLPPTPPRT
jgi:hypothetical protein